MVASSPPRTCRIDEGTLRRGFGKKAVEVNGRVASATPAELADARATKEAMAMLDLECDAPMVDFLFFFYKLEAAGGFVAGRLNDGNEF